jgi:hypothetical protein
MSRPTVHRTTKDADENGFEAHLISSLLTNLADVAVLEPTDYHVKTGGREIFVEVKLNPKRKAKKVHYVLLTIEPEGGSKSRKGPEGVTDGLRHVISDAVKTAVEKLGAPGSSHDPTIQRLMEVIARSLPKARRMASEATIEKLVDALVETQDPVAQASAAIDADNARARHRFMSEIQTLTAEEVARGIGSAARNRHQTASRWKNDRKIFSVPWRGLERYPLFQFKDGKPLPVIADVLKALPERMTPWETAFWFVSTNSWLDDAAPCDRLAEPEHVAEAARHEDEVIAG